MTTGYYYAIFPFCGGGKKKDDKKTKAFYDWDTCGSPVITKHYEIRYDFFFKMENSTALKPF